jgi:hypothetical protein
MLNKLLIGIFILIFLIAVIYGPKAARVYKMIHLYDEDKIVYNFLNMDTVFPTIGIAASKDPHEFPEKQFNLPEFYELDGKQYDLSQAL